MKNIIVLVISLFTFYFNLSAQDDIILENLSESGLLSSRSVVSENGEYIAICNYIIDFGGRYKGYVLQPLFSAKKKPTTIIFNIKNGKQIRTIDNFIPFQFIKDENKLLGVNKDGLSIFDIKTNKTTNIKGISEKRIVYASINNQFLAYFHAKNGFGGKVIFGKLENNIFTKTGICKSVNYELGMSMNAISENKLLYQPSFSALEVFNIEQGFTVKKITERKTSYGVVRLTKDQRKVVYTSIGKIIIADAETMEPIRKIDNMLTKNVALSLFDINNDASLIVFSKINGNGINILDGQTGNLIGTVNLTVKSGFIKNPVRSVSYMGIKNYFMVTYESGISIIIDAQQRKKIGWIYSNFREWAVIAVDGRMEGTENAINNLRWHNTKTNEKIYLSGTYTQYYTPKLLQNLLYGGNTEPEIKIADIKTTNTR